MKFFISESLRFGWQKTKEHAKFLLTLLLVLMVMYVGFGIISEVLENTSEVLAFIAMLVIIVIGMLIQMGFIVISLKIHDGQKPELSDMWNAWPQLAAYLGGSIVYGLIVLVGLVLLIVPGIIWAIKYRYFAYLIIDKKMSPIAAIKKSGEITQGVKWDLLGFGIVVALLNFLGTLALMIGQIITTPVTLLAQAYVYRKLLEGHEDALTTPAPVAPVPISSPPKV